MVSHNSESNIGKQTSHNALGIFGTFIRFPLKRYIYDYCKMQGLGEFKMPSALSNTTSFEKNWLVKFLKKSKEFILDNIHLFQQYNFTVK